MTKRDADAAQPERPAAYRHTSSMGVTYFLNSKSVTLRGGKTQTVYYFSRDFRPDTAASLPSDRTVNENPRNGFLTLRRKERLSTPSRQLSSVAAAIRAARAFPLSGELPLDSPRSASWMRTRRRVGIEKPAEGAVLPRQVAEAAHAEAAVIFDSLGFAVIWQGGQAGPDLLLLSPTEDAFLAVEVRGTMRKGVDTRALRMFAWRRNFIAEAGIRLDDAFGAFLLISFATDEWRCALTADFERFAPVQSLDQLIDLELAQ